MFLRKPKIGLAIKLAAFFSVFGALILAVFYMIFQLWVVPMIKDGFKSRLLDTVSIASKVIHSAENKRILSESLGEDSPEYISVRDTLLAVIGSNKNIDSIYTMVKTLNPDVVKFVVDAGPETDKNNNGVIDREEKNAIIGEEYDISDKTTFKRGFSSRSIDNVPYADKWGTFLSAVTPLYDEEGKIYGAIGADMKYEYFSNLVNDFLNKSYLIFGLLLLFSMALGYMMGELIVGKLKVSLVNLRNMTKSDSDEYLKSSASDEIGELWSVINEVVMNLRESKKPLYEEVSEKTKALVSKLKELELVNKMMVGREIKMVELKKEIDSLKEQLNRG